MPLGFTGWKPMPLGFHRLEAYATGFHRLEAYATGFHRLEAYATGFSQAGSLCHWVFTGWKPMPLGWKPMPRLILGSQTLVSAGDPGGADGIEIDTGLG